MLAISDYYQMVHLLHKYHLMALQQIVALAQFQIHAEQAHLNKTIPKISQLLPRIPNIIFI